MNVEKEELFTRDDFLLIQNIFQQFIDNQINENELNELLKKRNIFLPSSFHSLSIIEKKKYLQFETIWVDAETLDQKIQYVWNAKYFYELVRKAKRSQTITKWLMEYCQYLDCRPLYFLTMQNIKIKNLSYFSVFHKEVLDYAKRKKLTTLYDLLIEAHRNKDQKKIQEIVFSFFNKETSDLYFNIEYFPNAFAIEFEKLLYSLNNKKLGNEIRILFLIYKAEYFETKDFNLKPSLMKSFLKEVGSKSLTLFLKFARKHQNEIDCMPPNGYQAFYYSLLFQKEKAL